MARIVQKYGGTSVGDVERIKRVAERIKAARAEGNDLVIVVSARAGVTNELLARAKALVAEPAERELDQLLSIGEQETIALTAMALQGIGVPAVSYTGAQAGIFTDKSHTKAKIKTINAKPIEKDLKAGKVVIVAGFQGINEEGQITTLGRGGSDLTAIALAAALKADKCEIYTDVDGVYTGNCLRSRMMRCSNSPRPAPRSCSRAPSSSPRSTAWSSKSGIHLIITQEPS
jgi:aspartate kinase